MFLNKKKIILVKIETTEGTDAVPTADDVIECRNSKMERDSTMVKAETHRPSISDPGGFVSDIKGKWSCEVDMKASGVVATRSQLGKMLMACGFKETALAESAGLQYDPVSSQSEMKSVTVYEYYLGDGTGKAVLKKLVGAKGTATLQMEAGKVAKVQFNFEGRYVEPADVDNPSIDASDFESTIPPIVENSTFKYDNTGYVCRGVTINVNNDLYPIPDVNSDTGVLKTVVTGRSISGTMGLDMINVAVKNFFAIWKANTKASITMKVGATAGNIIEISMPAVQLEKVNDADDNGFAYQEIPFIATGVDDELSFVFK